MTGSKIRDKENDFKTGYLVVSFKFQNVGHEVRIISKIQTLTEHVSLHVLSMWSYMECLNKLVICFLIENVKRLIQLQIYSLSQLIVVCYQFSLRLQHSLIRFLNIIKFL